MKKVFFLGMGIGVALLGCALVSGLIIERVFPQITNEYHNNALFRPWTDPVMSLYFLHPFVLGIALTFVWQQCKTNLGGSGLKRGLLFGLYFWLISTLPGMFISYSSFPISFVMVLSWSINGLIEVIVGSVILAKVDQLRR